MRALRVIFLTAQIFSFLTVPDSFSQSNVAKDRLNELDPAMVSADSRYIQGRITIARFAAGMNSTLSILTTP